MSVDLAKILAALQPQAPDASSGVDLGSILAAVKGQQRGSRPGNERVFSALRQIASEAHPGAKPSILFS